MKYLVIGYHSQSELNANIEKYLQDGWEPLGGVSVAVVPNYSNPNKITLYQTLIKKDKPIKSTNLSSKRARDE